MKSTNIFITIILLFSVKYSLHAQVPSSYVNVGVGIGPNYGILGAKVVAGYKNSGALVGLGTTFDGQLGYEIGAQYADEFWFINAGYGVYSSVQQSYPFGSVSYTLKGIIVTSGIMLSVGKPKRFFFEGSIGMAFKTTDEQQIVHDAFHGYSYYSYPVVESAPVSFTFNAGLGYRIGGKK